MKTVRPAGVPAFDEINERVEDDVATQRGLADAKALVEKVVSRIENPTAPTSAAMRKAAEQFTVERRMKECLHAAGIQYHTRLRPQVRYGRAMSARLFALRAGEISEPPILDGEKSRECYLAALTGRRQAKSPDSERVARQFGGVVAGQRKKRLLIDVWSQFKPTPREQ